MSNRITTATLAHYIGAECEYRNNDPSKSFMDRIRPIDLNPKDSTHKIIPILRPIESMTQEDAKKICEILGTDCDILPQQVILWLENSWANPLSTWVMVHIIDYLRSKGFDLGGEIEQDIAIHSGPFGETVNFETKTVWVPSLIKAGVAKDASTPKFKVGDRIRHLHSFRKGETGTIVRVMGEIVGIAMDDGTRAMGNFENIEIIEKP